MVDRENFQPLKQTIADCQNIWFNNISWLVNCTELKPAVNCHGSLYTLTQQPAVLPQRLVCVVHSSLVMVCDQLKQLSPGTHIEEVAGKRVITVCMQCLQQCELGICAYGCSTTFMDYIWYGNLWSLYELWVMSNKRIIV